MPICLITSTTNTDTSPYATPVAYISSADFASPTTISKITIQNITGSYESFTVTRKGGGLGDYTSSTQNFPINSFTDPTTLENNTQYTYTITPAIARRNGITFTTINNPNNGFTPGNIYTLANVSGLNPVYSGASSSISSVYITWSNNGYTTLYLNNTTQGGGNYKASGTYYNSTTNGSIDSNLTANTQYTYTFSCCNGDGYYVANSACQTTVNTCTWGYCNAPTFFNTYTTRTSLVCTGLFNQVYITYSGGSASPASGIKNYGPNSTGQDYTSMTNTVTYTFVCYPVNLLGYLSSNGASSLVTPSGSSGPYNDIFTISSVTNFQSGDISGNYTSLNKKYSVYSLNTVNVSYTINYIAASQGLVQLFCIGGGGGGGAKQGGGGGAGGVIQTSVFIPAGSGTITVVVGSGAGIANLPALPQTGNNTTVTFNSISKIFTAYGGGTGSSYTAPGDGGSGGGGGWYKYVAAGQYPNDCGKQSGNAIAAGNIGNVGGGYSSGERGQNAGTGGGGGAGGAGTSGSINGGGYGGAGIQCTLDAIAQFAPSGISYGTYYWAGGGGGISYQLGGSYVSGNGGIGGGGGGGDLTTVNGGGAITTGQAPSSGTGGYGAPNTGSGGGGSLQGVGGAGGSGIVLIAFP